MNEISFEYDIEIYDLTKKYVNIDIFINDSHVAKNPKSLIFSEDIAKIIIRKYKDI